MSWARKVWKRLLSYKRILSRGMCFFLKQNHAIFCFIGISGHQRCCNCLFLLRMSYLSSTFLQFLIIYPVTPIMSLTHKLVGIISPRAQKHLVKTGVRNRRNNLSSEVIALQPLTVQTLLCTIKQMLSGRDLPGRCSAHVHPLPAPPVCPVTAHDGTHARARESHLS